MVVRGVVPVIATLPVLPSDTQRHYRETTTVNTSIDSSGRVR